MEFEIKKRIPFILGPYIWNTYNNKICKRSTWGKLQISHENQQRTKWIERYSIPSLWTGKLNIVKMSVLSNLIQWNPNQNPDKLFCKDKKKLILYGEAKDPE